MRKWTWASASPGSTVRPPRSIRSFETCDASPSHASTPRATRPSRVMGRPAILGGDGVERVDAPVRQDHARIVSRMPPIVPRQEIEQRIGRFQTALQAAEIDAALIVESSDLYYLTGTNQDAHLVVPAEGEPVYLVRRDLGRARDESPLAQRRAAPLAARPRAGGAGRGRRGAAARPRVRRAAGGELPALREGAAGRRARRLLRRPAAVAGREVGLGGRADPRRRRSRSGSPGRPCPSCSARG